MGKAFSLKEDQVLLGRYQLAKHLQNGGEGELWKAYDQKLRRRVALKFLEAPLRESPAARARLEQESLAYGRLDNPAGLVQVLDFHENPGGPEGPFLVMELLRGMTLSEHLSRLGRVLSPREIGDLIQPICATLWRLHNQGAVHRDVSMSNVYILENTREVRLLDLGLSLIRKPDGTGYEPHALGRVGTAPNRAPELSATYAGSTLSDIYSLGTVVYELATGSPVQRKYNPLQNTLRKLPPSAIHPEISPELEGVILRCTAEKPEERYQTVLELSEALAQVTGVPAFAPEELPAKSWVPLAPPKRRAPRRFGRALALAASTLALVAGASYLLAWEGLPPVIAGAASTALGSDAPSAPPASLPRTTPGVGASAS
jgi:serine/threonine-protein kinase